MFNHRASIKVTERFSILHKFSVRFFHPFLYFRRRESALWRDSPRLQKVVPSRNAKDWARTKVYGQMCAVEGYYKDLDKGCTGAAAYWMLQSSWSTLMYKVITAYYILWRYSELWEILHFIFAFFWQMTLDTSSFVSFFQLHSDDVSYSLLRNYKKKEQLCHTLFMLNDYWIQPRNTNHFMPLKYGKRIQLFLNTFSIGSIPYLIIEYVDNRCHS